jgi:hypothetical protein
VIGDSSAVHSQITSDHASRTALQEHGNDGANALKRRRCSWAHGSDNEPADDEFDHVQKPFYWRPTIFKSCRKCTYY